MKINLIAVSLLVGALLFAAIRLVSPTDVPSPDPSGQPGPETESATVDGASGDAGDGEAEDQADQPGEPVTAAPDMGEPVSVEVLAMAARTWGYVPSPGSVPDALLEDLPALTALVEPEVPGSGLIALPEGVFRLAGTRPLSDADRCVGSEETAFDCAAWSREGVEVLLASAPARCAIDLEASAARCEIRIGGDWIDLSAWSVRTGLLLPERSGPHAALEGQAARNRLGIWAGSFTPERAAAAPNAVVQ